MSVRPGRRTASVTFSEKGESSPPYFPATASGSHSSCSREGMRIYTSYLSALAASAQPHQRLDGHDDPGLGAGIGKLIAFSSDGLSAIAAQTTLQQEDRRGALEQGKVQAHMGRTPCSTRTGPTGTGRQAHPYPAGRSAHG